MELQGKSKAPQIQNPIVQNILWANANLLQLVEDENGVRSAVGGKKKRICVFESDSKSNCEYKKSLCCM